jgi:hypothetical protein
MWMRLWLWALPVAVAISACERQPRDAELLPEFAKNGCNPRVVIVSMPTSMSNATACTLVTTTLDFIGNGGARSIGVAPDDTARLSHASLAELVELPKDDAPIVDYYWEIVFPRARHERRVLIRVSRVTGKMTPEPDEIPQDEP